MKKPSVLLVEDSSVTQVTVRKTFESLGCDVFVAGSAEAALEWLEKNGPTNVLILDFKLPGKPGTELYRKIGPMPEFASMIIVPFTSTIAGHTSSDMSAIQEYILNREGLVDRRQSNPAVSKGPIEDVTKTPPSLVISVANAIRRSGIPLTAEFIAAVRQAAIDVVG